MQKLDGSSESGWRRLHSPRQWTVILSLAAVAIGVVPLLNAVVPPSSSLYVSDFYLAVLGKYLTFAILALLLVALSVRSVLMRR